MIEIFAHRGASREAPENSPQAFLKALEIGVDGVEIDCLMTLDGIPVVRHDTDDIHRKTFKEVKALGIPSLREILEIVKPSTAKVILDLKAQAKWMHQGPLTIAKLALEILPPQRILLSSFYFRHLLSLKRHFPHLSRGLILKAGAFKLVPPPIFDRLFRITSIHPSLKDLEAKFVKRWQRGGFKVYTWTVNTLEEFKKTVALGVDGIFTDDPRLAKRILT